MTLSKVAIWLCGLLGLGAGVWATPVTIENKATETTQIADKETGQRASWTTHKVVLFLRGKKTAAINLSEKEGWFSSALLSKDRIYSIMKAGKIGSNVQFLTIHSGVNCYGTTFQSMGLLEPLTNYLRNIT